MRAELQRVLSSESFQRSKRLSDFLRFIVEETLEGRGADLKEYVIGVQALAKRQSFDPRIDPIVRVEAGRLRAKLREYYDTQGRDNPIIIRVPKRAYKALFWDNQANRRLKLAPSPSASQQVREPETAAEPQAEAQPSERRPSGEPCIAALPFADMSPQRDLAYFCEGLADEIINSLVKVSGLRVVARTSSFQYAQRKMDVREIGRQLNADLVLEGGARKQGTKIRVTVQLINVADGLHLWSETYDRANEDILTIEEEISRAIVRALRDKLGIDEPEYRQKRSTRKPKAYRLYLKGSYYWNKRTAPAVQKGIEYLRRALLDDPEYAAAYAALANCYAVSSLSSPVAPKTVLPKARAAALRALELDAGLQDARLALGFVKAVHEWDWASSEKEFLAALQHNPSLAEARHWYAVFCLAPTRRLQEASVEIRRAQEANPYSHVINTHLGFVHYLRREYDQAIERYRMTLDLDPGYYPALLDLGRAYMRIHRYQDALEAFTKAQEMMGDKLFPLGLLGRCYALSGKRKEAQHALDQLQQSSRNRYVSPFQIAEIYRGLGENDAMFGWLEKAYSERSVRMIWLAVDPAFTEVRPDPRFKDVTRRMGLEGQASAATAV